MIRNPVFLTNYSIVIEGLSSILSKIESKPCRKDGGRNTLLVPRENALSIPMSYPIAVNKVSSNPTNTNFSTNSFEQTSPERTQPRKLKKKIKKAKKLHKRSKLMTMCNLEDIVAGLGEIIEESKLKFSEF